MAISKEKIEYHQNFINHASNVLATSANKEQIEWAKNKIEYHTNKLVYHGVMTTPEGAASHEEQLIDNEIKKLKSRKLGLKKA